MLDQDNNFYLISLSILITCLLDNVRIFGEKLHVDDITCLLDNKWMLWEEFTSLWHLGVEPICFIFLMNKKAPPTPPLPIDQTKKKDVRAFVKRFPVSRGVYFYASWYNLNFCSENYNEAEGF